MPNENHNPPHIVYTVEEVAALLKVSEKTVYRLVNRQILVAIKVLRHLRITKKSLDALVSAHGGGL